MAKQQVLPYILDMKKGHAFSQLPLMRVSGLLSVCDDGIVNFKSLEWAKTELLIYYTLTLFHRHLPHHEQSHRQMSWDTDYGKSGLVHQLFL